MGFVCPNSVLGNSLYLGSTIRPFCKWRYKSIAFAAFGKHNDYRGIWHSHKSIIKGMAIIHFSSL